MISRPLSYSLTVHLFVLAMFLYSLSHESKKESRTSVNLQMIALPSHLAVQPKEEIISQPKTPTSITKAPLMPVSLPKNQKLPTVAAVVAPTLPQQPTPPIAASTPPQVQPPKVIHTISAPPPVPSVNVEKEFLDAHLGEIRTLLIQNLRYPRNAQRLKMQGEVRVSFRLKSDGSVENIEVVQSSGFEILDEDAKALIKNTASHFPKPSKNITLSVPLAYVLR